MKNPTILILASGVLVVTLHRTVPAKLNYPLTETVNVMDTYFDTTISDPYRWLEDDHSKQTKAWVTKQNSFTNTYMRKIPYRRKIEKRLKNIWNFPSQGMPFKEGEKYYFFKNDGLQSQSVMHIQDSPTSDAEVFMDPNKFSKDGAVALGGIYFSHD